MPSTEPEGQRPAPPLPSGDPIVATVPNTHPLVQAAIVRDTATGRLRYIVEEPRLNVDEASLLERVRDDLVRTLPPRPDDAAARAFLEGAATKRLRRMARRLPDDARQRILYHLVRDALGFGPIDALMRDPDVEDISCDGPGLPVFVVHRRHESMRTPVTFEDEARLDAFVVRLAQLCGRQISYARPLVEGSLPDGSRLQASLSREVTTRGSSFTIRRFRAKPFVPTDLIRLGTLDPLMAAYLWTAVEERFSLLFVGGTAAGKTTTMNAACMFVSPDHKIVSLEDTRELHLPHENWIAGLTRSRAALSASDADPSATIDLYRLLESALRQRPDYIVVGEVRGAEAVTMFQAMATGHATFSTLHADSARGAVRRLENPPLGVPRALVEAAGAMVTHAQVRVRDRLVRRIQEVVEILGVDRVTGDLLTRVVFRWNPDTDSHEYLGRARLFELARARHAWDQAETERRWKGRAVFLARLAERGPLDIRAFMQAVADHDAGKGGGDAGLQ